MGDADRFRLSGVTAEDLAETVPVDEVGKAPRPASPTQRTAPT